MKLKNTKVLVTGANGFIGSHLVGRLLKEESNIAALIKTGNIGDVEVFTGDITDYEFVKSTVDEASPDIIYHLAASLDRSFDKFDDILNVNFNGTLNLLKALKDKKYHSFVFVSTAEVYGKNKVPFKEDTSVDPISPYSLSKLLAEFACKYFFTNFKSPITILRAFIVYGPGQKSALFIPSMINGLINSGQFGMTQGKQTRDFVFVDDFIDALVLASLSETSRGEVINICSGEEHAIKEVSEIILGAIGKGKVNYDMPYRSNEQWRYFGDNSKARKLIGWKPKVNLKKGLIRTVKSYIE